MTVPTSEERYGQFAANQLAKYGWKAGKGLGREEEGIKRAINITKKDDTKGLGKGSDAWGFAWWDHIYNKSSSAIKVEKSEEGITVKSSGNIERNQMGIISTERPNKKEKTEKKKEKKEKKSKKDKKIKKRKRSEEEGGDVDTEGEEEKPTAAPTNTPSWIQSMFVACSSGGLDATKPTDKARDAVSASDSEEEEEEEEEARDYSMKISDSALLAACGGRTARKGARAEQPAKLKRVDELIGSCPTTEILAIHDTADDISSKKSAKPKKSKSKDKKKEKKEKKEKRSEKDAATAESSSSRKKRARTDRT